MTPVKETAIVAQETTNNATIKLAQESAMGALSISTLNALLETIAKKDNIISNLQNDLSEIKEELVSSQYATTKASMFVNINTGRFSEDYKIAVSPNLVEVKAEIEALLRKEYDGTYAKAVSEVVRLTNELKIDKDTNSEKLTAELAKQEHAFRMDAKSVQLDNARRLSKKDDAIQGLELKIEELNRQIDRLVANKEYAKLEDENVQLRARVIKAEKRFINLGFIRG